MRDNIVQYHLAATHKFKALVYIHMRLRLAELHDQSFIKNAVDGEIIIGAGIYTHYSNGAAAAHGFSAHLYDLGGALFYVYHCLGLFHESTAGLHAYSIYGYVRAAAIRHR